ncbi:GNAT family N-acetyltransferase [Lacticaseibacillus absianus]|uniref:GNAT family N-acetyltransferase n=1 Tax=Lacticaseibacillus absianus TaxID=2729623 RepID=UPI0015C84368|nr:GNAT family N-acetyltransferase [Lacticaseibacillus absianus]
MISYTWQRPATLSDQAILALYASVGWTAYLKAPANTLAGIADATVLWALDGPKLVGLARAITDHHTILYVQDVLVTPAYQRRHIGSDLLTRLLDQFADIGQTVLLTDPEVRTQRFYGSLGFHAVTPSGYGRAFVRDTRTG